jgi:hypothetical protein
MEKSNTGVVKMIIRKNVYNEVKMIDKELNWKTQNTY